MKFFFILLLFSHSFFFSFAKEFEKLDTLLNQKQQTSTSIQENPHEASVMDEGAKNESQIFQYMRLSQGTVKSRYHQGGVSFDVDPD